MLRAKTTDRVPRHQRRCRNRLFSRGIECYSIQIERAISRLHRNSVAGEDPMSRHAGTFTLGVLASAVFLAGSLGFSLAQAEPPNFAANPNIGWYSYSRTFISPATGPGPVQQDPSRPHVTNDRKAADPAPGRSQQSHPPALGEGCDPQAQRNGARRKARCGGGRVAPRLHCRHLVCFFTSRGIDVWALDTTAR